MNKISDDELMEDLRLILSNFQGREYLDEINAKTRFFADLGLASIDAVMLGEVLERHYARRLPFLDLLAELGKRSDRDLSIGELAAFLKTHL